MLIPGFLFRIMTSNTNKTNLSGRNVYLDIKVDHGIDQVEGNDDEPNPKNSCKVIDSCKVMMPIQQIDIRSDPNQTLSRFVKVNPSQRGAQNVIVRVKLDGELNQFILLLDKYSDAFAWSYADMPGSNTDIIVHHLPLHPKYRPIKQETMKPKKMK